MPAFIFFSFRKAGGTVGEKEGGEERHHTIASPSMDLPCAIMVELDMGKTHANPTR